MTKANKSEPISMPVTRIMSHGLPISAPVFGSLGIVVLLLVVVAAAQVAAMMVSFIRVTLPFRDRSLPSMLAPFATVIEFSARILPLNTAVVFMVAVSTLQKTLQA